MPILPYKEHLPTVAASCWIAPNAFVTGKVTLGEHASIFFGASLRGDIQNIIIGANTNIQDNAVIHSSVKRCDCEIGAGVTIGHGAIIHGARIRDHVIVGMNAVVLDEAEIGEHCIIGASSLVTQRTKIPPRSLVFGNPAKVIRPLTEVEIEETIDSARRYVVTSQEYKRTL